MFALCSGMRRSASTVQYQLVADLVERKLGGRRLGFMSMDCVLPFRDEALDNRWLAVKMHDAHATWSRLLHDGRAQAFYIYRDIRDVVMSTMQMQNASFNEVVRRVPDMLETDAFWRSQPNTLVQRYEDGNPQHRVSIHDIATHLGLELHPDEAATLASAYSFDANRARVEAIARVYNRCVDSRTRERLSRDRHHELHWNHMRSGTSQGWREAASPSERSALDDCCGEWLDANGYERNDVVL